MTIDEKKIERLSKKLNIKKGRTVADLAVMLGVSVRTVFRYLKILQGRGVNIERVGIGRPTYYRLV